MLVTIYQIKDSKFDTCDYVFGSWNIAKTHGFTLDDYDDVYSYFTYKKPNEENGYRTMMTEDEIYRMLDKIYEKFNVDRPEDFKGHSLSTSDVVDLGGDLYYCDSFGWEKVE